MIRLVLATVLLLGAAYGIFTLTESPTRTAGADLLSGAPNDIVARARTADPTAPALAASTGDANGAMASMTAGVVANIGRATGVAPVPTSPAPVASELDALTRAVLAGLGAPAQPSAAQQTPPAPQPPATPAQTLSNLVDQAMREGEGDAYVLAMLGEAPAGSVQPAASRPAAPASAPTPQPDITALLESALATAGSDAYLDQVLNAAADAGQIAVPAALRTPDGRIDTQTLLADILQKSSGAPSEIRAPSAASAGGIDGVEVRVVQTASATTDALFYTVQPGDSLGAIAQRFYGDASLYQAIFEANRRILSTPDRIRVGQRLILPDNST